MTTDEKVCPLCSISNVRPCPLCGEKEMPQPEPVVVEKEPAFFADTPDEVIEPNNHILCDLNIHYKTVADQIELLSEKPLFITDDPELAEKRRKMLYEHEAFVLAAIKKVIGE